MNGADTATSPLYQPSIYPDTYSSCGDYQKAVDAEDLDWVADVIRLNVNQNQPSLRIQLK